MGITIPPQRQTVPHGTRTCPKDGGDLHHIVEVGTGFHSGLQCQKCRTVYDEALGLGLPSASTLGIPIFGSAPAWAVGGNVSILGSTSKALEAAQAETIELRKRVDRLESQVKAKIVAPPRDASDDGLRTELADVRKGLDGVDARIQDATKAFAALLPDATEIAYLKVAKAEAGEIRRLLTEHMEDDHRRKAQASAADTNRWAKIAVGVSLIVAVASIVIAVAY